MQKKAKRPVGVLVGCVLLLGASAACGQDWPQWRGPNRDNKVTGFTVPATWPKELTKKWKTTVGGGDSSPTLVGDKVYVFARQGGDEVTWCLDAASGKEVWKDKFATQEATKAAGGIHAGPRATPAVAEGKVCTFGVRGIVSCLDAATGKVVWRKDTKDYPTFFTAASPLIVDGKCITYIGGTSSGEIVAYDLATGEAKWKWSGDPPSYGSPAVLAVDGVKQLATLTKSSLVGISMADGKLLWKVSFGAKYNNSTPIIDGQTVICSSPGPGTVAFKIEKEGDKFTAKQLWKSTKSSHQYNTPVLKDGLIYGITPAKSFFCMDAKTGDVLWTDQAKRGECGTVLDAGGVLLALTSDKNLVAFTPSNKEYKEVAKFAVAESATWANPIVSGNRVFVKDQTSVALWTIE